MFEVYQNIDIEDVEDTYMDEKTEKMIEYIRSLRAIEDAMEPYKEQKRELRKEFKEQGWLSGDEISLTVKAYRMMKSESFNLDEFVNVYNALATPMGKSNA